MRQVAPYTALSTVYDVVMEHVDYERWADYISGLIEIYNGASSGAAGTRRAHRPARILELGCGTGRFAAEILNILDCDYTATDMSPEMLQRAVERFDEEEYEVRTRRVDFRSIRPDHLPDAPFDIVLLLYDGFNYLMSDDDALSMLNAAAHILSDRGTFFVDQVTPPNSENNMAFFEDEGRVASQVYRRTSHYDVESRVHTTEFEIEGPSGAFAERHEQRIWTIDETRALISGSPFEVVAAYDGFSLHPADSETERIHWILQKKASTLTASGRRLTSASNRNTS